MSKIDQKVKPQTRSEQTVTQQVKPEQITKPQVNTEQITKPGIGAETNKDFFVTYKQNVEKYFENMENSIPKYYQTLTELQQEFLQAWENMYNASISVQKEFVGKNGLDTKQTNAASKFVSDTTEAAIKARTVRDKIILTSLDTTKESVKEWNRRSQEFAELNRKIMQSWISSFTARKS